MIQYVDPGTGSLLTQLFFSLFIGIGFYLVRMRRRVKSFVLGRLPARRVGQEAGKPEPKAD